MKNGHRHWLSLASPLLILFLVTGAGGLREDELACEEAAAHLQKCCPKFRPQSISCQYDTGCGSTEYPSLSTDDSKCIQHKDCATLQAEGLCESAQNVDPIITGEDAGAQHGRVCR